MSALEEFRRRRGLPELGEPSEPSAPEKPWDANKYIRQGLVGIFVWCPLMLVIFFPLGIVLGVLGVLCLTVGVIGKGVEVGNQRGSGNAE